MLFDIDQQKALLAFEPTSAAKPLARDYGVFALLLPMSALHPGRLREAKLCGAGLQY